MLKISCNRTPLGQLFALCLVILYCSSISPLFVGDFCLSFHLFFPGFFFLCNWWWRLKPKRPAFYLNMKLKKTLRFTTLYYKHAWCLVKKNKQVCPTVSLDVNFLLINCYQDVARQHKRISAKLVNLFAFTNNIVAARIIVLVKNIRNFRYSILWKILQQRHLNKWTASTNNISNLGHRL